MKIVNLLALSTDITIEKVFQESFVDTDVRIVTSRLDFKNPLTETNLRALEDTIRRSILLDTNPDLVVFGCTSASILIGQSKLNRIYSGIISPLSCLLDQPERDFFCVGAYTKDLTEKLMTQLNLLGFRVDSTCLGYDNDIEIAKIDIKKIKKSMAKISINKQNVLYMCTALDIIDHLEDFNKITGKKSFSSNQLLIQWIKKYYGISD